MNLLFGIILPGVTGFFVATWVSRRGASGAQVALAFVAGTAVSWLLSAALARLAVGVVPTYGLEDWGRTLSTGIKVAATLALIGAVGGRRRADP